MKLFILIFFTALGLFALQTAFYTVEQDEKAVVLTCGIYSDTVGPGPHFKLPTPIQTIHKEKVTHVRRIEIGFRTINLGKVPAEYRDFKEDPEMLNEAQMFTGDENIVNVEIVVQYEILSLNDWLFNVADPEPLLRMASESALRQAVGDHSIDDVLVQRRAEISNEIRDKIAKIAKNYGLGVRIDSVQMQEALPPKEVSGAFKDVATAKEESAKLINQATGYQNEKIHFAGGQSAKIKAQSAGYASERVALATGEVERFKKLAGEFQKNPDLMKDRLYLETLGKVLPKIKKIIIDKDTNVTNLNPVQPFEGGK